MQLVVMQLGRLLVSLHLAFNRFYEFYEGANPPLIPTRVRDEMMGGTISIEGVLVDFPSPFFPKINVELTREGLVDLHQLISGNVASVALKLGGCQQERLALTITAEEYM